MYQLGACKNNPPGTVTNPWRPKDGPGPRGSPDCYYWSRVLNSTGHYVDFVNSLRKEERRIAKNDAAAAEALLDKQKSECNVRNERRNYIGKVARKVELCLESVEDDIEKKRERLRELLTTEEQILIPKFVKQAQEGKELIAKQREERLQQLQERRRIAQQLAPRAYQDYLTESERYHRNKEEKMAQQYQIHEKQAMKSEEMERDKMWNAVGEEHDGALELRMAYDAVDRYRRDRDCKKHSDKTIKMKKDKQEAERKKALAEGQAEQQRIKKEQEEAKKAEAEKEAAAREKSKRIALESLQLRAQTMAKKQNEERIAKEAYESVEDQWRPGHAAKLACIKRRKVENAQCNRMLIAETKTREKLDEESERERQLMATNIQKKEEERRCNYTRWAINLCVEANEGRLKQVAAKKIDNRELSLKRDSDHWAAMNHAHLCKMDEEQLKASAEKRKEHQRYILQQAAERKTREEKLLAEEAAKKYDVTLPDRVDETEPRPEDRHAFSRRLRAARSVQPLHFCNCKDK